MDNKYDETIEILANMSKVKMVMNAHKGSIEDLGSPTILSMLRGEVDELQNAIGNEKDIMHVIEEAADVMNFLVAVTHQQIEKYRTRKND